MPRANHLTHDQRMTALTLANRVRFQRAAAKRLVATGKRRDSWRSAASLLDEPPEDCAGLAVRELLLSVRWLGPEKVAVLMRKVGIGPSTTIGGLTERQRRFLTTVLRAGSMTGMPDVETVLISLRAFAHDRMRERSTA